MSAKPPKLVWCLGMFASGSTWLFNAARAVAQELYPQQRVAGHFAGEMKLLRALPRALNVVKTHELNPAPENFMATRADAIFITLRDPRDAVTSLVQYMGDDFATALRRVAVSAQFCTRHAGDMRARLFIYESGFTESEAVFDILAKALGGTLTPDQRAKLFAATRRDKIEEKISRLEDLPTAWRNPGDDLLDRDTQWHRHHTGRTGESGRWRRLLTPAQAGQIEVEFAEFMRNFGYSGERPEGNTRIG